MIKTWGIGRRGIAVEKLNLEPNLSTPPSREGQSAAGGWGGSRFRNVAGADL